MNIALESSYLYDDCKFTITEEERKVLLKNILHKVNNYTYETIKTEDVRILLSLLSDEKAYMDTKVTYCQIVLNRIKFYLDDKNI